MNQLTPRQRKLAYFLGILLLLPLGPSLIRWRVLRTAADSDRCGAGRRSAEAPASGRTHSGENEGG